MNKLYRLDIQKIEHYWINHKDNNRQLKYRELELLKPKNEIEMNTGGGRSGKMSTPTENKAILLAGDKRFQNLQQIVNTIESMYAKLDRDLKTIVDMRYWDIDGCYEWENIADKLYMTRHKVLRKRNILSDKTAERIGWV